MESKGEILKDESCPLCGYSPIYKEDPKDEAPHPYYCHACNRGFDQPRELSLLDAT